MEFDLNAIERNLSIDRQSNENDKEFQLAKKLKQICSSDGRELDVCKSAVIFHDWGKEYQQLYQNQKESEEQNQKLKSENMFCLIKSAAFFNAALARKPSNVKSIQKDLKNLCELILKEASGKYLQADLIGKSKEVKNKITQWRKNIKRDLYEMEQPQELGAIATKVQQSHESLSNNWESSKIDFMRQMQNQIAEFYIKTMADIATYCENLMGPAPFEFAIAGMGSLARRETTPYSDFEHIILLSNSALEHVDYEKKLNYFRWFSLIFQIIVINLQETIIPSIDVFHLNNELSWYGNWFYDNITTRGISFDGMMLHACKFPLGRQHLTKNKPWKTELIKPVDEMLNYLNSEEDVKNGYHLKDILTKTCFVYKSKSLFDYFSTKVSNTLEQYSKDERVQQVKKQVQEDLENFFTGSNISKLKTKNTINVKKDVYRSTTLFVSALGSIHNCRHSSSFDVIAELANKQILNRFAEHNLKYAVALACEIRLKWYLEKKQQCDSVNSDFNKQTSAIAILASIVGKNELIKYFQIAYSLQCDIAKRLKLQKRHMCTNPYLFNISVGLCFDQYQHWEDYLTLFNKLNVDSEKFYDFEENLSELTKSFKSDQYRQGAKEILNCGMQLLRMGLYEVALECFENVAMLVQHRQEINADNLDSFSSIDYLGAFNFYIMGSSLSILRKREDAVHAIAKCMSIMSKIFPPNSVAAQFWIGRSLLQLRNVTEAIEHLKKAIEIKKSLPSATRNDNELACCLYWAGICFQEMGNPEAALEQLEDAQKELEASTESDSESDKNKLAYILYACGKCFYLQKKFDEATNIFEKSISIRQGANSTWITRKDIAETQLWLGKCLKENQNFDNAIKTLQTALHTLKKLSVDESKDNEIAETQYELGYCQLHAKSSKDAKGAADNLQNSLRITENSSSDINSDAEVLKILKLYCECLIKAKQPNKALDNCKRLLQMQEKRSPNIKLDKDIAQTLEFICQCLLDFEQPCKRRDARKYLHRELHIAKEYKHCNCIGCCSAFDVRVALCCVKCSCNMNSISSYRRCCRTKTTVMHTAICCLGPCTYTYWLFVLALLVLSVLFWAGVFFR